MHDIAETIMTNFSVKLLIDLLKAYPLQLFFTIAVLHLLRNRFLTGLNRIPGPAIAAWSALWRLYDVSKGDAHNTAIALHRKYGPLVRIGPKHVSVGDPAEIQNIYGLKKGFTKVNNHLHSLMFASLGEGGADRQRRPSTPSNASAGTKRRR